MQITATLAILLVVIPVIERLVELFNSNLEPTWYVFMGGVVALLYILYVFIVLRTVR
ncbi:hypothetical protein [Sporomusa malonica]|uniref:Uncharacterized protein n=1 Tax=Sporomusa malonica TaxID=112901 RepID=A0A1W2F6A1_9FIRM|nr:hypothetical protein [Sporomusa malonica]SMD17443.1 hypothetical protein SAMN04488500_1513 [Sporomusa malonica]